MTERKTDDARLSPQATASAWMSGSRRTATLLLVFLLAFVVRLVMVHLFARPPMRDLWWNDSVGWNLAMGNGFTASLQPPFVRGIFRSPGYPIFLAAIYKVFGHSYYAAYLAQAALDAGTAVLILLAAAQVLAARTTAWTGFLYALYPYPAIFCGVLSQDLLLVFAVVLTLYLTLRAQRTPRSLFLWFLVGLALGWATLVKPFLILYAVVQGIVLLLAQVPVRRKLAGLLVVAAASGLLIMPWLARNYEVFHVFPLPAAGGTGSGLGFTLMELKYGESAGLNVVANAGGKTPMNREQYLAAFVDGQRLVDQERELSRQTTPELLHLWPQYLLLMVRHVPRLWLTTYTEGRSFLLILCAQAISILFLIAGAAGMLLAWPHRRDLVAVYLTVIAITLMYAPVVIEARYSLPARPAMMIFVAVLVDRLMRGTRPKRTLGVTA